MSVVLRRYREAIDFHGTDVTMMGLTKLTKEIKPLTRVEKLQLIEAISKMLLEEESPEKYLDPAVTYPLFTPLNQEKAALQLQQFLDQQQP